MDTDTGPADYMLFIDGKACGVIEAKREGTDLGGVAEQSGRYATSHTRHIERWTPDDQPLPFLYEATNHEIRFRDERDPHPRSRYVFHFHQPDTLKAWLEEDHTLRARLHDLPALNTENLRNCQIDAIHGIEESLKAAKPRALLQMATGSGKTYTAVTEVYRLAKFAKIKRALFLVDRGNLASNAKDEFEQFVIPHDGRKFTQHYNVNILGRAGIPDATKVTISTIQRMYAQLTGQELDDEADEHSGFEVEASTVNKEPRPVSYNPDIPIEAFDAIIIDECHRSIYNLWRQVLEYFDAFLIGLTATPDNRTYGFFQTNVVSEYDHERAVADGVNVGNEIYLIETERTQKGGTLTAKQMIEKRERLSRKRRWEYQDEEEAYSAKQLDRDIVNPNQIRTVIETFRDKLPDIFPGREEVPKTLIFAKTDSHADDIIQTVREVFGEGNEFCKKVTYQAKEDPKSVLAQFRNDYNPRIAVTVDMIATGTDVKPLECLLFMRDVKSRNYFEQMKGRGTRTLDYDDLRKVTPSAISAKTHYVIVDAIGVTKSLKTDSQPLITKPSVPLKDLAMGVMMGARDEDTVSSLAGRLARLNKQLDEHDQKRIKEKAGGVTLTEMVGNLLDAIDPDRVETRACEIAQQPENTNPGDDARQKARDEMVGQAANVFTGELVELLDGIRRDKEQTIDHENLDKVKRAEWAGDAEDNAKQMVQDFSEYLQANRDEIDALTIFYQTPQRRSELTYAMIREVFDKLKTDQPRLAPLRIWQAYNLIDNYKGQQPVSELTALVALIRRACGIDSILSPYADTVRRNFQNWVMTHHSGGGEKFNEEQMAWLRMIRDHIISSFHMGRDDLDMAPFDAQGGMGRMHQLFGDRMDEVIGELNEALAA